MKQIFTLLAIVAMGQIAVAENVNINVVKESTGVYDLSSTLKYVQDEDEDATTEIETRINVVCTESAQGIKFTAVDANDLEATFTPTFDQGSTTYTTTLSELLVSLANATSEDRFLAKQALDKSSVQSLTVSSEDKSIEKVTYEVKYTFWPDENEVIDLTFFLTKEMRDERFIVSGSLLKGTVLLFTVTDGADKMAKAGGYMGGDFSSITYSVSELIDPEGFQYWNNNGLAYEDIKTFTISLDEETINEQATITNVTYAPEAVDIDVTYEETGEASYSGDALDALIEKMESVGEESEYDEQTGYTTVTTTTFLLTVELPEDAEEGARFTFVVKVGNSETTLEATADVNKTEFTPDDILEILNSIEEISRPTALYYGANSYELSDITYLMISNVKSAYYEYKSIVVVYDAEGNIVNALGGITGDEAIEVARYNLQGQRINGAETGINIVVYSDGSSKKVLVK